MKSCPKCSNYLKKIEPRDIACTYFEYAFCTYYKCHNCLNYYAYCNLCRILIDDLDVNKHGSMHPSQRDIARGAADRYVGEFGWPIRDLFEGVCELHPQFYTMRVELPITIEEINIEDFIHINCCNNYSCALCGMDYDAFPNLKRVRHHLWVCSAKN